MKMSEKIGHVTAPEEFQLDELEFRTATRKNWNDLESLFSERGVQGGCWCMYWRVPRTEFTQNYGQGNKKALHNIVDSGIVPGILAYYSGKAVGWCSVAPRQDFTVLGRSPTLKPVDDEPAWAITCFFVAKEFRRRGLNRLLIEAAIKYAKENGAKIVEAYPIDPDAKSIEYERYTGLTTTFEQLGFKEIVRRSNRRPIMRYTIKD